MHIVRANDMINVGSPRACIILYTVVCPLFICYATEICSSKLKRCLRPPFIRADIVPVLWLTLEDASISCLEFEMNTRLT